MINNKKQYKIPLFESIAICYYYKLQLQNPNNFLRHVSVWIVDHVIKVFPLCAVRLFLFFSSVVLRNELYYTQVFSKTFSPSLNLTSPIVVTGSSLKFKFSRTRLSVFVLYTQYATGCIIKFFPCLI